MKINDRILVFNIPYVYIYMSDKEIDEKLRAIYYGPNVNTSSAKRLYQAARGKGLKVTMPQVNAFITKQAAFQKTKTFTATKKLFSSIIAPRPGAGLQARCRQIGSANRFRLRLPRSITAVVAPALLLLGPPPPRQPPPPPPPSSKPSRWCTIARWRRIFRGGCGGLDRKRSTRVCCPPGS